MRQSGRFPSAALNGPVGPRKKPSGNLHWRTDEVKIFRMVRTAWHIAQGFRKVRTKRDFAMGRPYWAEDSWGRFKCPDIYSLIQFAPDFEKEVRQVIIDSAKPTTLHTRPLFVDVGANIGRHAVMAARLGFDVVALEPDSQAWAFLEENIAENCPDAEVKPMNAAAWSNTTELVFHPHAHSDMGTIKDRDAHGVTMGEGYTVRAVRLDEYLHDKGRIPDLIKIDVEGAEYEALLGLTRTIVTGKPLVVLECLTSNRLAEVTRFFSLHGYAVDPLSKANFMAVRRS